MKLGYGGTKEEMQRLLADAEKFSGVHYDISNLNDVYSAIHVIQTEMGITGTTAKEAATTISGSAASMKSAWQNMLVGVADDNADFDALIENLVTSVGTFADNIIPRVQIALGGIGSLISELAPIITAELPGLIDSILPGLIDAASSVVDSLVQALPPILVSLTSSLVSFLAEQGPTLITSGAEALTSLLTGFANSIPDLLPVAIDAVLAIGGTILDNLDTVIDAGIELIFALVDGLIDALPDFIAKAPEIISKFSGEIINNAGELARASLQIVLKLASAIISNLPQIAKAAWKIIKEINSALNEKLSDIWNIGKNIVSGIWAGIQSKAAKFKEDVKGFFKGIIDSVKNVLGIRSPSRIFRDQIGKQMAAGVGVGFANEMQSVRREIVNEVNGITSDIGSISTDVNVNSYRGGTNYFDNGVNRIINAMRNLDLTARLSLDSREIRYGQQKLERAIG